MRQAVGRDVLTGRRELTLALPDGAEIDVEQARAAAERARAAIAGGDCGGGVGGGLDRRRRSPAAGSCPATTRRGCRSAARELEDLRLRALESLAQAGLALGGAHADGAERAAGGAGARGAAARGRATGC